MCLRSANGCHDLRRGAKGVCRKPPDVRSRAAGLTGRRNTGFVFGVISTVIRSWLSAQFDRN
jgi:hypothetical protein